VSKTGRRDLDRIASQLKNVKVRKTPAAAVAAVATPVAAAAAAPVAAAPAK
jgi:hypothetical protein